MDAGEFPVAQNDLSALRSHHFLYNCNSTLTDSWEKALFGDQDRRFRRPLRNGAHSEDPAALARSR